MTIVYEIILLIELIHGNVLVKSLMVECNYRIRNCEIYCLRETYNHLLSMSVHLNFEVETVITRFFDCVHAKAKNQVFIN